MAHLELRILLMSSTLESREDQPEEMPRIVLHCVFELYIVALKSHRKTCFHSKADLEIFLIQVGSDCCEVSTTWNHKIIQLRVELRLGQHPDNLQFKTANRCRALSKNLTMPRQNIFLDK